MAINKKDKTNSFEDLQSISGRDLGELAEKSITEDLFKGKQKRCKIATPSNKRSLRRNSQFKSSIIITPDWTSLDQFSPFYDPEEDTYKITVATNYETIGNQADKIYNEAKLIAANSIVEVYNKVAIKKDIEELVTSSSVLEYYVPIRPNPKCGPNGETIPLFGVKVLISIPGERVDKLKIAKNLIEQALPFANKEINLLSSEIKEKIKNTSSTIRSFYEDVVNSGNTVKGMSLDKEADRLEEFLFVLENLLSANGLFLREDRDDLIIIGVSDKDKVLYVLYDDGQEFSSLQAGLNLFLKTKSVSNEKTIRLLMEMGKLQGPGSGRPQYPVTDFLRNVVNQGGNVGLSLDQDIFDVVNRRAFAGDSVSPEEVSKELETYVQETNSRPIKTEEEKETGSWNKLVKHERTKLDKIMEEQKLQTTGLVDANTASKIGRILGLDAIVIGSISQFGVKTGGSDYLITQSKQQVAECTVDIRVIEVETGRVLYIDSGKGVAKSSKGSFLGMGTKGGYDETLEGEALRAAIAKFVDNIVDQVNKRPWSCRVAEVDGNTIYLDAGRESNLKLGTRLVIYRLGKEIKSPDTGMVIGRTEEKAGEIEVIDYFGDNGSTAKIISGSNVQRGNLCRLVK